MKNRLRGIRVAVPALALSLVAAVGAPLPVDAVLPEHELSTIPTTGLNAPQDVGVAKDGVIYIADTANNAIVKVATDNTQSTFIAAAGATHTFALSSPSGIDVDYFGVVYIADTGNHRILKFDPATNTTTVLAGTGAAGNGPASGAATAVALSSPSDVAVAGTGIVYVSDTGNSVVRRISANGTTMDTIIAATELSSPRGIAVDKHSTVYIADTGNHRVRSLTTAGTLKTIAGTGAPGVDTIPDATLATAHPLNSPLGVSVDTGLAVYITDTGNSRIRKVSALGFAVELAAPAVGESSPAIGAATVASPQGITTDKHGSLFLTTGNTVVKVFQPDWYPPEIVINHADASKHSHQKPLSFVYTCTDFYSGIDPENCVGSIFGTPVPSGTAISTASKGFVDLAVTGTDRVGNAVTVTSRIQIVDSRVVIGEYAGSGGNVAAVARLYIAIMKRQPESQGHAFWLGEVNAGRRTLREAASFFISKEEFQSLYGGNTTDFEYIDLLYGNIMGRPAVEDPVGRAFWRNALTVTHTHDRTDVALFFSQSEEILIYTETS